MEALSSKSRIRPCPDTFAISVSDTALSFQRHYERFLSPTTPLSPNQSNFSFVIPPSVSSELYIPLCQLEISFELKLQDGSTPASSTQVSIINAFAATMWADAFVRINGSPFLPEITHCSHYQVRNIGR